MMPKIDTIRLGCLDPDRQCEFYCDVLGMRDFGNHTVGYDSPSEARICFVQAEGPYRSKPNDVYWKIALAAPNIELACQQLAEASVNVGTPHQFQDVGYLAHFADPEGYTIELIDHWFEGQRPSHAIDTERFGGGAHLNLLTLRTGDIISKRQFCLDLGMRELAVQPVESHGFTLYFYAFTTERPPNTDLLAIENRPWLYQRPYTVLEIQHIPGLGLADSAPEAKAGYQSTAISGLNSPLAINDLKLQG